MVVEIRSPGDESYEKLEFYALLGVPEAWVIHRDSKQPEVHRLAGTGYQLVDPDPDGWHRSRQVPVEMRGESGKLVMRLAEDAESQEELPE